MQGKKQETGAQQTFPSRQYMTKEAWVQALQDRSVMQTASMRFMGSEKSVVILGVFTPVRWLAI
jgi:hypothetical protein